MSVWYILKPFGIFSGYLVYFPRFGMLQHEKSGNPDPMTRGNNAKCPDFGESSWVTPNRFDCATGADVKDFRNVFAESIGEKNWQFLPQKVAILCHKLVITLV
jgi:hypothetical protein